MAKKRKNAHTSLEISTIEADDPRITIEKKEMMRLTKAAKSWEFTCSFCFKKFASAQAMGGHKNAHRGKRLEEKWLFVRDPIGYRKRAFLRAVKTDRPVKMAELNGGGGGGPPRVSDSRESNGDCSRCEDSSVVKVDGGNGNFVVMNLLPPKEVSVDETLRVWVMESIWI